MPSPRNALRGRRSWDQYHRRQLATGFQPLPFHGWGDGLGLLHPAHRHYHRLADIPADTLQDMAAAWEAMGAEIIPETIERSPGARPWFLWLTELLPAEPLRIVDAERFGEDDDAHLQAPGGIWQEHNGCESSLSYLLRNRQIGADELQRLRQRESSGGMSAAFRVPHARGNPNYPPFHWHSLACAAFLLGDDLLTPDEREAAADELRLLRSWEAAAETD